jgi:VIT1/CCC1 family predicted Fe2+/Mn2+ transporter
MKLNDGVRTGLFFGTTSGVITPCGLLVGLAAGTGSIATVVSGILIVAIADSLSDALGIHLSEESRSGQSAAHVWTATAATFFSKLVVALTFVLPFLLLPMQSAIIAALLWGALLLTVMSQQIARLQQVAPLPVIAEHLTVASVVIVLSHLVGVWIRSLS